MASLKRRGELELRLPGGVERFRCRIEELELISEYEPDLYSLFKRLMEERSLADVRAVLRAVTDGFGDELIERYGLIPAAECAVLSLGNGLGIDQEDSATTKKVATRPLSAFANWFGRVRQWVGDRTRSARPL